MTDLRPIGDGPNPLAPPPQKLSSREILRLLALDPYRSMERGRLRATRDRLQDGRRGGGRSAEQQLLDWSLSVEPKRDTVERYDNPARINGPRPRQRSLSLGDFEFVRSFDGADPSTVSVDDVKHLAELEAAAESQSDRRVVARVFGPIRAHHDRREEEAELRSQIARHQPSGWRSRAVLEAWEPVLAQRLAEEARAELEPQLRGVAAEVREKTLAAAESEAKAEARQRIDELWADLDAEASERVATARARLAALAAGADPTSSAIALLESGGMEAGRRRGREDREEREARNKAFAEFGMGR